MGITIQRLEATGTETFSGFVSRSDLPEGKSCGWGSFDRPRYPSPPDPAQGSRLRDARVELGLGLRDGARAAGWTPVELSSIEMSRGAYLLPEDEAELLRRWEATPPTEGRRRNAP